MRLDGALDHRCIRQRARASSWKFQRSSVYGAASARCRTAAGRTVRRPELTLEFTLRPGEMYFINNYTILHARTAFDDGDAEEDRRRHLLRLWLEVPEMRPVHPYIRRNGIEAVPGRTPSFDWSKLTNNRN